MHVFNATNFEAICDELAALEPAFAAIIAQYGYPHFFTRPKSFETLVRLILEQQVSLASAKAAFDKLLLVAKIITPEAILVLSDDDLRTATITRQKIVYIRILAEAIQSNSLVLNDLDVLDDDAARAKLTALKGIGAWTSDVFLMECLQRADVLPIGDVALRTAMKKCLSLPKDITHDALIALAERYRPYRSVATTLFWHDYVCSKNIDLEKLLS